MAKNLQPLPSRTVLVTKRGATVNGTQSGVTSVTVHAGALRFADGDRVCLHDDETVFVTVNGTPGSDTVLPVTPAINVTDGDRIINLGADTGTSTPNYDGADSKVTVYTEPTTSGDAATNNQVTTNSDGEFTFYAPPGVYDVTILDSSGNISANSETLRDVEIGGGSGFERVEATSGTSQEDNIQAAIDGVNGLGGGIVELGPGTFTIDTAVTLKSSIWLRGSGMGVTIIKVKDSTAINVIEQTGTSAVSNVHISDLTLDGNDANQSAGAGLAANLRNITTLFLERVEAKNTRGQGIVINANDVACERWVVSKCYIHDVVSNDTSGSAISVAAASGVTVSDIIITENLLEDIGDGNSNTAGNGIMVSSTGTVQHTQVIDNIIRTVRTNAITVSGTVGKTSARGNYIVNAGQSNTANGGNGIFLDTNGLSVITENTIDGVAASSDNAIEVSGAASDKVVIANNRITGVANANKSGISIGASKDVVISGNNIHNVTGNGIDSGTTTASITSLVVSGNNIETAGGLGIRVRGRTETAITGNVVKSSGSHGIFVSDNTNDPFNVAIVGNVVTLSTLDGIVIDGTSSLGGRYTITGNVTHANTNHGIQLIESTGVVVSSNDIEANAETGVLINKITGLVICGNVIKGNGTADTAGDDDGIKFESNASTDVYIYGNQIIDHTDATNNPEGINTGGLSHTRLHIGPNYYQNNDVDVSAASTAVTIATGVITAHVDYLTVDTESAAASDNLDTINGGYRGRTITLKAANDARTVVLTESGNISVPGGTTLSLDDADDSATLTHDGTSWQVVNNQGGTVA